MLAACVLAQGRRLALVIAPNAVRVAYRDLLLALYAHQIFLPHLQCRWLNVTPCANFASMVGACLFARFGFIVCLKGLLKGFVALLLQMYVRCQPPV